MQHLTSTVLDLHVSCDACLPCSLRRLVKSKTELQDRSGHLQQELLLRQQDLKRCTSALAQIREDLDAIHFTSR